MNWLDFGVTRSKVKGQRSQGSLCMQKQLVIALSEEPMMDSCQTLVMYVSCRADELIRFWYHEVKGQRSQGSLCMQKQLVIALSQEPIDGFLPNFGHVCILQSRWTDYINDVSKRFTDILLPRSLDSGLPAHNVCTFSTTWGAFKPGYILQTLTMLSKLHVSFLQSQWPEYPFLGHLRSKVRGHGLIMYALIVCAKGFSVRTVRWLTIWTHVHLVEPMNWVRF